MITSNNLKNYLTKSTTSVVFFVLSNLMNAQDSTLNTKISELEKEKSKIETEINELKKQLPVPVKPTWTFKGNFSANIGQTMLSNWAAGGFSSFNFQAIGHAEANYAKGRHTWLNSIDARIGFVKNYDPSKDVDLPLFKNADQFLISSTYNYSMSEKSQWSYAFLMNFGSQFIKTWDANNSELLVSDFFAPAVLNISPGLTWKPKSYLTVFMTPASGQFNFVYNDFLIQRAEGAFGNKQNQNIRSEFGARVDAIFEKDIIKNLTLRSRLQLFNNFTRSDKDPAGNSRRWNVDITSQTDIFYKITKSIALNFSWLMIYDDDILIASKTGEKRPILQIREAFGIGFTYGF